MFGVVVEKVKSEWGSEEGRVGGVAQWGKESRGGVLRDKGGRIARC